MSTQTAWVKEASHSRGLDPLGVQAPCINLYGQLLPGITNVTDRARYYSFYPWVVWAYDKAPGPKNRAAFIDWVRKADCLFTMIGTNHRLECGDNDLNKHDRALVGRERLGRVVEDLRQGGSELLSKFAVREDGDPNRYFKNTLGGLRQYYIGTFDGLGLMTRSQRVVKYTPERGEPMALALDQAVDRKLFTDTIQGDEVTSEHLKALADFCPCQLQNSSEEHNALIDLFFDKSSQYSEEGKQRRRTLGLFLDLARQLPKSEESAGVDLDHLVFRGCVYTGFLPNGEKWNLAPSLEKLRFGWAVYQRNELLSVAAQCIFWVALRCLKKGQIELATTDDFIRWFSTSHWVKDAATELGDQDFKDLLKSTTSELPMLEAWHLAEHELNLARQSLENLRGFEQREEESKLLVLAARILLTLVARDDSTEPAYGLMTLPKDYLQYYPVNLDSIKRLPQSTWQDMTTGDWLAWLAGHWGIEAHLRVALRKLRYQSQDTFHVLPTDRGLFVAEMPSPTYTTPRFTQAIQVLQDIGAINRPSDNSWLALTHLGEELRSFSCD